MNSDVYARLDEIAAALPHASWMLVGGLMVHCHAQRASIQHARATDDADLVLEVGTARYAQAAAAIESIGYARHLPLDGTAPFHRFMRNDREHVDLMVADEIDARFAGRPVLAVPGARSALKRTIHHDITGHCRVRLPDVASALALKGAAYRQPGSNRLRHLQDGVTLFACAGDEDMRLSKSMRAHVNALIGALDDAEAWALCPLPLRRRAVLAIRRLRPDWQPPTFVLPTRHRPGSGS